MGKIQSKVKRYYSVYDCENNLIVSQKKVKIKPKPGMKVTIEYDGGEVGIKSNSVNSKAVCEHDSTNRFKHEVTEQEKIQTQETVISQPTKNQLYSGVYESGYTSCIVTSSSPKNNLPVDSFNREKNETKTEELKVLKIKENGEEKVNRNIVDSKVGLEEHHNRSAKDESPLELEKPNEICKENVPAVLKRAELCIQPKLEEITPYVKNEMTKNKVTDLKQNQQSVNVDNNTLTLDWSQSLNNSSLYTCKSKTVDSDTLPTHDDNEILSDDTSVDKMLRLRGPEDDVELHQAQLLILPCPYDSNETRVKNVFHDVSQSVNEDRDASDTLDKSNFESQLLMKSCTGYPDTSDFSTRNVEGSSSMYSQSTDSGHVDCEFETSNSNKSLDTNMKEITKVTPTESVVEVRKNDVIEKDKIENDTFNQNKDLLGTVEDTMTEEKGSPLPGFCGDRHEEDKRVCIIAENEKQLALWKPIGLVGILQHSLCKSFCLTINFVRAELLYRVLMPFYTWTPYQLKEMEYITHNEISLIKAVENDKKLEICPVINRSPFEIAGDIESVSKNSGDEIVKNKQLQDCSLVNSIESESSTSNKKSENCRQSRNEKLDDVIQIASFPPEKAERYIEIYGIKWMEAECKEIENSPKNKHILLECETVESTLKNFGQRVSPISENVTKIEEIAFDTSEMKSGDEKYQKINGTTTLNICCENLTRKQQDTGDTVNEAEFIEIFHSEINDKVNQKQKKSKIKKKANQRKRQSEALTTDTDVRNVSSNRSTEDSYLQKRRTTKKKRRKKLTDATCSRNSAGNTGFLEHTPDFVSEEDCSNWSKDFKCLIKRFNIGLKHLKDASIDFLLAGHSEPKGEFCDSIRQALSKIKTNGKDWLKYGQKVHPISMLPKYTPNTRDSKTNDHTSENMNSHDIRGEMPSSFEDSGIYLEIDSLMNSHKSLTLAVRNSLIELEHKKGLRKTPEYHQSRRNKLSIEYNVDTEKRRLLEILFELFFNEQQLNRRIKTITRSWSHFTPEVCDQIGFPLQQYFQRLQSGPPLSLEEQMAYEWFRFTSFASSYTGNCSGLVLARNGFYHEQDRGSTATRCYACGVRRSTWNDLDNIEEVHRNLSPNCLHVNHNDSASGNVSITTADPSEPIPQVSASNAIVSNTEANVTSSGAEGGGTNDDNSLASKLENLILQAGHGDSNEDRQPSQPTEDAENIHFGSSSLVLSHQSEYAVEGRTGDGYPNRPSRMPRFATTNNNLATGARTNTTVNSHAANISAQAATSTSTGAPSTNTGSLFSATLGRPVGAGAFIRQTPGVGTPTTSASQPSQPSTPGGPTGSQPNQGPAGNSAGLNNAAAIVVQSPKHPDYASLERRTESFTGWPSYLDQTPLQMASAGFFYAGVADFTRCYCCGGGLRNWEPGDDPVLEHTRWYSTCEYVKKLKGDRYVQAVIRRQQQHLAERQRQQRLQEQRREEQLQQGVQGPDPMTSPAAPVLTEMGYSTERVREAILAVRRQTGLITIMPDQALTWILDDEEQPSNRTAASRPPSSTTSVSSRAQTSSAAATTQSVTTSTGSVAASQARTATTAATSQARTATTAATSQTRTATTAATSQARTATTAATSRARTATTSATSQTKTAATSTPAVTTTTASAVSGASSITSSVSTASITAVAGSLQGEEGGSSSGVNASAATNKKADTSQPQTSTGKKKNGRGKKGKGKPPTVAASLLEDAAPSDLDTQSLKEENEKLREMQTCKICMERPVNTTFLPCGHLVCCEQCAPRLAKCPICRVRIKGTVKTFMS